MEPEVVHARGHEHVRAAHTSTLEVTTDDWLTPAGDCIVGIAADRAPADFAPEFVSACQQADARITLELAVSPPEADRKPLTATVTGRGHPDLTVASDRSLVCRTSTYVDDRTVMVDADAAAASLDRTLVDALAAGASLECTLRVS